MIDLLFLPYQDNAGRRTHGVFLPFSIAINLKINLFGKLIG
jgi:hypothetical protein